MQLLTPIVRTALPTGFLQEPSGTYSSMRLMSMLSLVTAIGFGVLGVLGKGSAETPTYVLAFLTAAFGPKIAQKPFEAPPAAVHEPPAHG